MRAKTNPEAILPDRAAELISDWFGRRGFESVVLEQNRQPRTDPDDSYVVEYEAIFIPPNLEQAQVEVWATDDGYVAIGLETTGRIAERLGVKRRRNRFAAGHEPRTTSESGLLAFLDCVADGQVAILARVVPLLGLVRSEAVLLNDCRDALASEGYAPLEWLNSVRDIKRSQRLIRFNAWR